MSCFLFVCLLMECWSVNCLFGILCRMCFIFVSMFVCLLRLFDLFLFFRSRCFGWSFYVDLLLVSLIFMFFG